MSESWIKLVQRVYKEGKAKNASYKFKEAMVDAKKIYKAPAEGSMPAHHEKKSRKHRKSMHKSKKSKKHTKKHRKGKK